MKNQLQINNLPDPISIREAASKYYVDDKFRSFSLLKTSEHFNDKNQDNVPSYKMKSPAALREP